MRYEMEALAGHPTASHYHYGMQGEAGVSSEA